MDKITTYIINDFGFDYGFGSLYKMESKLK